jgi:putative ABC transport system permease protein
MKFNGIAKLAFNSLSHRGLRSWLTILGIVIGVAAVVSILSIGAGMQQAISSQLGGLGADVITVSPGGGRATGMSFGGSQDRPQTTSENQNLTDRDVQMIKTVPGVLVVDGMISGRLEVSYLGQSSSMSIRGVDPLAWSEMETSGLEAGRYLTPGDGNVVVIGYSVANSVFKQPLTINTQINIAGKTFKVAGILKASGASFNSDDNAIFMPVSAARTIVEGLTQNQLSSIQLKVADANSAITLASTIEQKLMLSRHVTNTTKDFTVTSAQSMQQTISSVMGTLNLFLGGIAAISLLVGAIGIANTMFMSVMERTRQIGTLKALGTTSSEIMKLFLFESSIIGFIGGLIGIFLGFIASGIISELGIRLMGATGGRMSAAAGTTVITPELVLFALGFSIVVGALSGIIPARNAAKLQPVEALRYE